MSDKQILKKQKAGRQDLLFGIGKAIQQRGQKQVEVDKIGVSLLVETIDELKGIDPEEFPVASLLDDVGTLDYVYWPNAVAEPNNAGVIESLKGNGRWVLANNYRRDRLILRDITQDSNISALDSYVYLNVISDDDIVLTLTNHYDRAPMGAIIYVHQAGGLGRVSIAPDEGVTVNSPGSLSMRTRFSTIALVCKDWGEWDLMGDIND